MSRNIPAATESSKLFFTFALLVGVALSPLMTAFRINAATDYRHAIFHCLIEAGRIGALDHQTAARWASGFWQWIDPDVDQLQKT